MPNDFIPIIEAFDLLQLENRKIAPMFYDTKHKIRVHYRTVDLLLK